jgi:hypothetical protein
VFSRVNSENFFYVLFLFALLSPQDVVVCFWGQLLDIVLLGKSKRKIVQRFLGLIAFG